jgi:hypothetical protein
MAAAAKLRGSTIAPFGSFAGNETTAAAEKNFEAHRA